MDKLSQDAILRVGEVTSVNGNQVIIKVDKNKNHSDLFVDRNILNNISVNGFIEIRKGFMSIIGKVEGEKIEEDIYFKKHDSWDITDKNRRYLQVNLRGYFNNNGLFVGGTKEMPLIGNEAFVITKDKIEVIHNLVHGNRLSISVASTDIDNIDIRFPIDGLFNTHIAIFGNTGSGKSNTLACIYQEMFKTLNDRDSMAFKENAKFVIFDFNGEYTRPNCITNKKKVYNISTKDEQGDKIPLDEESMFSVEILSILADATEKTQKPFIKRALRLCSSILNDASPNTYFKNILRKKISEILKMKDAQQAFLLIDYLKEILPQGTRMAPFDPYSDLEWHNKTSQFKLMNNSDGFLPSQTHLIKETNLYKQVELLNIEDDGEYLSTFIKFMYLQLVFDVISSRAKNEHIAPAVNKLKSKQKDIGKVFSITKANNIWDSNFIVINMHDINLEMKKTIPLLLAKKLYSDHKLENNKKSLNLIIDEAHNILSKESFREAESWKDYRLETFEEIIKEGRKYGVFVTISSQRPSDISATITSQAHNYFIHRLVNQKDLLTISNAVSYIDKVTEESIPTLPTGTCIFSGIASQVPLKINVKALDEKFRPSSNTLQFSELVGGNGDGDPE